MPFKDIEVGINRKSVCDFLLVINTDNLSRTVSELLQLVLQILDTAFLSHPLGGVRAMYDVHVVGFLLVLLELFSYMLQLRRY